MENERPESTPAEPRMWPGQNILRRVRHEVLLESLVALICFCLAFGLTSKIVLAIVLTCIKFAVPDFITAVLVLRSDPDRWHGIGVAFLFVANGFARASGFAFAALLICGCIVIPLLNGWANGQVLIASLTTAALCAFGFLAIVFPLSFAAWLISLVSRKPLSFARELTKIRRFSDSDKKRKITPNVGDSLSLIAFTAGFSLTTLLICSLMLFAAGGNVPDAVTLVFVVSAVVLPFVWIAVFLRIVSPK